VELGAIFFPTEASPTVSQCVPVAPISQAPPQIAVADGGAFLSEWGQHFSPPWTLLLATPLGDALNQVEAALTPAPPGKAAVVVLTDGQPTCGEKLAGILSPVKALAARGILTHVIGLPGANGATVLMAVADAGGTGNYLLPSDTTTLQNEVAQIASGAVTQCVITLSPPPQDLSQVHLVVTLAATGNQVQIAQSVADGGWSLGSDGVTATLLGDNCAQAEAGAFSQVEFDYGCVSVPFE